MINFENETYENIRARMLSNIDANVDKREGSLPDLSIASDAYELATIYNILTLIQNNSWILTATGESLDNKCLERGIIRKEATAAIKMAYFNLEVLQDIRFSTVGQNLSLVYKTIEDSTLETTYSFNRLTYISGDSSAQINYGIFYATDTDKWYRDGIEIEVNEVSSLPTPDISTSDKYYLDTNDDTLYLGITTSLYKARVECETEGTIGNTYTGNIIPVENIQGLTTSYIGEVILAGSDIESDISLRTRFLATLGSEDFAGNITSYRTYTLSINGVGAVQVYPHWDGPGTVKLSILDSGYNQATSALIELVQNTICPPEEGESNPSELGFGIAPIGAKVTVETPNEVSINLALQVRLQSDSTIADIQSKVERVFEEYLLDVRTHWGDALISNKVEYLVSVYTSRISANILNNISEVVSINSITVNGESISIDLHEDNDYQEVPTKGTITITEV